MHLRKPSGAAQRLFGITLFLFTAIAGAQTASAAATVDVYVGDFHFFDSPDGVHFDPAISVGDTIHWIFYSGFHSSTSVAGISESWNSGDQSGSIGNSPTFDHTFTHAGSFQYYCDIHGFDAGNGVAGGMSAIISVRAVPEPVSATIAVGAMLGLMRTARRGRC
jgi:plastocyanin